MFKSIWKRDEKKKIGVAVNNFMENVMEIVKQGLKREA